MQFLKCASLKISSLAQHVHVGDSKVPITSFSNAQTRRRYLSNYFPTLNTNQALYGIADASVVENEALFSQVQQFIIHCNRFV